MGEALEKAVASIKKDFGDGAIMDGQSVPLKVDIVPTGSLSLDRVLGVGGIPRGRITECYGREGSSKTTLMQHIIASGQRLGLTCAYIDVEHALDRKYAEACGVNFDTLLFSQPDTAEEALEIAERLTRTEEVGVIVLDSVAALLPKSEAEADMGEMNVGLQARLMGQGMRKLKGVVHKANVALCLVNQLREKPGAWAPNGQVVEVTPGGRALKFAASVRLDMRKIEDIKDGKENIGIRVRIKAAKLKVAPPLKECVIDVLYGIGIDTVSDLLEVAIDTGVVAKGGAWLKWNGFQWQGKEQAKLYLRQNADLIADLDKAVRERLDG